MNIVGPDFSKFSETWCKSVDNPTHTFLYSTHDLFCMICFENKLEDLVCFLMNSQKRCVVDSVKTIISLKCSSSAAEGENLSKEEEKSKQAISMVTKANIIITVFWHRHHLGETLGFHCMCIIYTGICMCVYICRYATAYICIYTYIWLFWGLDCKTKGKHRGLPWTSPCTLIKCN